MKKPSKKKLDEMATVIDPDCALMISPKMPNKSGEIGEMVLRDEDRYFAALSRATLEFIIADKIYNIHIDFGETEEKAQGIYDKIINKSIKEYRRKACKKTLLVKEVDYELGIDKAQSLAMKVNELSANLVNFTRRKGATHLWCSHEIKNFFEEARWYTPVGANEGIDANEGLIFNGSIRVYVSPDQDLGEVVVANEQAYCILNITNVEKKL